MKGLKKVLLNQQSRSFSSGYSVFRKSLFDLLNRNDSQSPYFQVSNSPSTAGLASHQGLPIELGNRQYESSQLSNGVKVLTESTQYPSNVHLGILLDLGTRDENLETTGSLLSIKNTYMKTVLNTNETVNYGMVQMAGGEFNMDYDQETTYFGAHCLSHDVVDILNMMADCALEPRSVTASSVGQEKNKESHNIQSNFLQAENISNEIFRVAYGLKGLGMPLKGLKQNITHLNAYTLQKFQLENIRPENIIVCSAGVENHNEFVDLVNFKLGSLPKSTSSTNRTKTEYLGGEVRNLTDSNDLHLSLVFNSVNHTDKDFYAVKLAQFVLGNSNSSRISQNLVKKLHYVESGQTLMTSFSDSGLFGLQVSGSSDSGNHIIENMVTQLKSLNKISAQELQQAKAQLLNQTFQAMDRTNDRLEESARNLRSFGKVVIDDYAQIIESITADQVSKAVSKILQSNLSFVAVGGAVNKLHSHDKITNLLRQ